MSTILTTSKAEDRAYKEKITQEAQEHADAFVKSSAEWQKKLAEEHGLTYEPTMSLEKQAAHIRDTMVEYQLKSRETLKKWANRIDDEGNPGPSIARSN